MKKLQLVSKDVRREPRNDGWKNFKTMLGTSMDKRTGAKISWELRDPEFYEQLYAGGGIPARIVDIVPDEAMREGWDWTGVEPEQKEKLDERCEQFDLRGAILKTWKWGRAYGGACLHIVTDTSDPASPLRRGERVLGLRDLSRWDLRVLTTDIEYDFGSPNWGHPRLYYLNVQMGAQYKSYPIHWSRMIRFDGQLVPRRTYIRNNYWHDSVLNRIYDAIRDYQMSNEAAAAVLQDFNVDVFKLKNLAALIGAGNEDKVKARIDIIQEVKSIINAVIIDADMEEWETKSRPLEGVADLLDRQTNRLVAETDIPHTKLLGESPDGSNATGNSTSQQWYNFLSAEQRNYLTPKLKRLQQILFPEIQGLGHKFNPLRKLDALEEADLKAKMAETDSKYIASGVLDPTEVADSRFGGEVYSTDTTIDKEARAAGLIGQPPGAGGPGDPNDPNGGEIPPQVDEMGNEIAPGEPGSSPQGFEPPAALLMQPGDEDSKLAEDPETAGLAAMPGEEQPGEPGAEEGGLAEEGADEVRPAAQNQIGDPTQQQESEQEQGTPEDEIAGAEQGLDVVQKGVEAESDPTEAAMLVAGEKPAAQDEVLPFPAGVGVQGGKPKKAPRVDANWEEGKHKRAQGGKFGSGGGGAKPAAGKGGDESESDDDGAPVQKGAAPEAAGSPDGTFEVTDPSSPEEAAALEDSFKEHTNQMFAALQQAKTPQERDLVRKAYQASYAEYQEAVSPFLGGDGKVEAPAPKGKKKPPMSSMSAVGEADTFDAADPSAIEEEDDGEDDQSDSSKPFRDKLKAKGMLGEGDEPDGVDASIEEEKEEVPLNPNSAEGQSLRQPEVSGGNDFALRNETAPVPENPLPPYEQMVSQMMSEPMRDPRTDPKLPGPGTPKRQRTVLPTRGTGLTAPSGSDPALDAGAQSEAPEEEARETQDAAWNEGKHKRGQGGKFGSGGAGKPAPKGKPGAKPPAKPGAKPPAGKKPKGKGKPKPKHDPKHGEEGVPLAGAAAAAGTAILEKLKEQAEHGDADHPVGGVTKRAACVIVRKGDKFLMGKRRDGGKWSLPGGHVERGESHHQGGVRELMEETGFQAKRLKFLGGRMVEPEQGVSVHINLYEHKVEDGASATGRLDPDREFAEYRWVSALNQLPEDIAGNLAHPNNVALLHLGLLK